MRITMDNDTFDAAAEDCMHGNGGFPQCLAANAAMHESCCSVKEEMDKESEDAIEAPREGGMMMLSTASSLHHFEAKDLLPPAAANKKAIIEYKEDTVKAVLLLASPTTGREQSSWYEGFDLQLGQQGRKEFLKLIRTSYRKNKDQYRRTLESYMLDKTISRLPYYNVKELWKLAWRFNQVIPGLWEKALEIHKDFGLKASSQVKSCDIKNPRLAKSVFPNVAEINSIVPSEPMKRNRGVLQTPTKLDASTTVSPAIKRPQKAILNCSPSSPVKKRRVVDARDVTNLAVFLEAGSIKQEAGPIAGRIVQGLHPHVITMQDTSEVATPTKRDSDRLHTSTIAHPSLLNNGPEYKKASSASTETDTKRPVERTVRDKQASSIDPSERVLEVAVTQWCSDKSDATFEKSNSILALCLSPTGCDTGGSGGNAALMKEEKASMSEISVLSKENDPQTRSTQYTFYNRSTTDSKEKHWVMDPFSHKEGCNTVEQSARIGTVLSRASLRELLQKQKETSSSAAPVPLQVLLLDNTEVQPLEINEENRSSETFTAVKKLETAILDSLEAFFAESIQIDSLDQLKKFAIHNIVISVVDVRGYLPKSLHDYILLLVNGTYDDDTDADFTACNVA